MPFIMEALDSVLSNASPDLEVIVMENFSTDGTTEWLAAQSDPRLRVIVASSPVSAGANWTAACASANGKWIKLLCADDYVMEGGIDRQLAAATQHPDAALIASRRRVVSHEGRLVLPRLGLTGFRGYHPGERTIRRAVLSGVNPFGEPSSVMFRADALKASLPFVEDHPYLIDLDMYVRVLKHGNFVGLPSIDGVFRLNSGSWSAAIGRNQLKDYKAWVRTLPERGILSMTASNIRSTDAKIQARFVGRRAVTISLAAFRRR
jgi:glycosyltransferase involved in cell wall biosynthesis